jgi:hypothetical protein
MLRFSCFLVATTLACWPDPLLADTLCIQIVDHANQPVSGVAVTLASWTSYTDAQGRVCFNDVPAATYQVSLRYNDAWGVCNVITSRDNFCEAP